MDVTATCRAITRLVKYAAMKSPCYTHVFHALAAVLLLAGCYSMETATTTQFRNDRILGIDAQPVGHAVVSNYGWYLFDKFPLVCGNPDPTSSAAWSFFDDEVTPDAVQNDLTRYAAKNKCEVVDLNFYRDSTCMLPIPYVNTTFGILWYREIQVSGVLVRPDRKEGKR